VVRVPSIDVEDLRRSHRERSRLISERTAHVNRIKGLLFAQGIRGINVKARYKILKVDQLVAGEGRPLPPRLAQEGAREIERLALVQQQITAAEAERDKAEAAYPQTEKKRLQLLALKSIGPTFAAVLAREVYYRQFGNRRQVAGFLGLATSPFASGELQHCQGISRAGRGPVRATIIQMAWLWIKHQPKSAITQWFLKRIEGQSNRIKRVMIVAVARKLAIALWRVPTPQSGVSGGSDAWLFLHFADWLYQSAVHQLSPVPPARSSVQAAPWQAGSELPDIS
jgi:transposase